MNKVGMSKELEDKIEEILKEEDMLPLFKDIFRKGIFIGYKLGVNETHRQLAEDTNEI